MDLYEQHHTHLVRVHAALRDALRAIVGAETAIAAGQFLLGHHHAESAVLFPGLRRHGRLASDDIAFLDARDREHAELHGLCERLLDEAGRGAPRVAELRVVADAILLRFLPHIAEEEEGLAPERLRRLIQPAGLAELGRELEALRKS
jgi:hypothetical protein